MTQKFVLGSVTTFSECSRLSLLFSLCQIGVMRYWIEKYWYFVYLQITGGTPSAFTSLGPTGDLLFNPQISGIGGYVYSTISLYTSSQGGSNTAYDFASGTSMASPYTAG